MEITRKSMYSGIVRSIDIAITEEQLNLWLAGQLKIQDAAPHLLPWEREFIMTGITDEEWKQFQAEMEALEDEL